MKASIKAKFSVADIKKHMDKIKSNFDEVILNRLSFVGEKFIINARNNHTYKDQTGNLTSSIGYFILKDQKIMMRVFDSSTKPNLKNKNSVPKYQPRNLSNSILAEALEKFPKGFVLVGFAGMEYAAAVESKNYDVITSSAITAEKDLRKSLEELRNKLNGKS